MIKVLVYTCGGVSEKNPIKECLVCLSNLDKLQLHITTRDRSFNLLVELATYLFKNIAKTPPFSPHKLKLLVTNIWSVLVMSNVVNSYFNGKIRF